MAGKITKDMNIMDIVQQCPESIAVFQKYGLGCIGMYRMCCCSF